MAARLRPAISDGVSGLHLTTIEEIVACCVALNAEKAGGPLSVAEKQQIAWSAGIDFPVRHVDEVRIQFLAGKDPLGDTLSAIRSPANRRDEGAIYTPHDIVSAMVSWVLAENPGTVVDPGCGSGRFALEVSRRAGEGVGVIAIDSDPVGTLICRAGLAVVGSGNKTVINGDYLTTEFPLADSVAGFVGNPPYVRHHGISPHHKDWGRHAADQLGIPWSGLAGMHVLFILAAALRMRAGDVASFITSAEWLDVGYKKILRALLANDPRLGSVHLLDPRASAFANAITTSVIICAERGATNEDILVRTFENVEDLTGLRQPGRTVPRRQFLTTKQVDPALDRQPQWRKWRLRPCSTWDLGPGQPGSSYGRQQILRYAPRGGRGSPPWRFRPPGGFLRGGSV